MSSESKGVTLPSPGTTGLLATLVDRTITRSQPIADMAQPQNETLKKIREYSEDFDASSTEARLEQTVKELQARVQEQQAALDKVMQ